MCFLSREIPSRAIPWYLYPVPCNPVKSQSRPNFPFNPVMVQSRPIKTPSYSVPGNPGISRSRGIPSRDENSVPRKTLAYTSTSIPGIIDSGRIPYTIRLGRVRNTRCAAVVQPVRSTGQRIVSVIYTKYLAPWYSGVCVSFLF